MANPSYRIDRQTHSEHHRRYHFLNLALFLIVIAIIVGIVVAVTSLEKLGNASSKSAKSQTLIQHFAGARTFKNAYFEFSDTNDWQYAANDSTSNKIVYLLYADGVPARSLTVYVNQTPLQYNLATSYVLPVQIINSNTFSEGAVSAPCSSLYGPADRKVIKTVSLSETSFLCVPDSPQYTISVGQVGGGTNLDLMRSNGQATNYIIIYHDLSVTPDPSPFLNVIKTFKAL
jgi:hypothetical protein